MVLLSYWSKLAKDLAPFQWDAAANNTWPECPACSCRLRADLEWFCCSDRNCPFGTATAEEYHARMYSRRAAEGSRQHTHEYDVKRWVRAAQKAKFWLPKDATVQP